ncbi:MAG: hypothetical protein LPK19_08860 [Hymenobacteraceae bacterium]|nr:hypothetical protein [Hymenobacteraceae bacterium]MDX5396330.1 hypothetical protein [Hymenobacteraceae bacterium]MDX5512390.1 hypothetical protein [Hymenobacteraceae bacterium]
MIKQTFRGVAVAMFLFASFTLQAQNQLGQYEKGASYPGYAITTAGDTIKGIFRITNKWDNQLRVMQYESNYSRTPSKIWKPEELKAYSIGDLYYESLPYGDIRKEKRHFVQRLQGGCINLYAFYQRKTDDPKEKRRIDPSIDQNFAGLQDADLYKDYLGIKKGSDEITEFSSAFVMRYKKAMSEYTKDCPEVSEKIAKKEKGFNYFMHEDVVKAYNECCAATSGK